MSDFFREVVLIQGRLHRDPGPAKRLEHGRETARGRIGSVASLPVAGVEDGKP
jgi:hypothetical protein